MRRGLGKGLAQLVAEQADGSELELSVDAIVANSKQPRTVFKGDALKELADSIREVGIIQPLIVRPISDGRYELIAGERRLRAAKIAGLSTVPVVVRSANNQTLLEMALVENIQREDISPLECAMAYARLIEEFGLRQEQVASRVGKSRAAVANTLRLLKLPEPVREALASESITEGHARAILMADTEAKQLEILERVLSHGLSVRETEELARPTERRVSGNGSHAPMPQKDPNLVALEDSLSSRFGTKVVIRANRLEFQFYDEEDLTRICDLLGVQL